MDFLIQKLRNPQLLISYYKKLKRKKASSSTRAPWSSSSENTNQNSSFCFQKCDSMVLTSRISETSDSSKPKARKSSLSAWSHGVVPPMTFRKLLIKLWNRLMWKWVTSHAFWPRGTFLLSWTTFTNAWMRVSC